MSGGQQLLGSTMPHAVNGTTDDDRVRAERATAVRYTLAHANDVDDAHELLDMLGLDPAEARR